MVEAESEVVLLHFCLHTSHFGDTCGGATVVAGAARLGVFPLHIKACLRCVSAGFLPGRLYGNLALS